MQDGNKYKTSSKRCEIFGQSYLGILHYDVIHLVMDTLPLDVKYLIIDMLIACVIRKTRIWTALAS
jgi:hypothetical protein